MAECILESHNMNILCIQCIAFPHYSQCLLIVGTV